MSQVLLFDLAPYLALIAMVGGLLMRWLVPQTHEQKARQRSEVSALVWSSPVWKIGIVATLIGHLLPVLFPQLLLTWTDDPQRLFVLETAGLGFGILALAGLVIGLIHQFQSSAAPWSLANTLLAMFLLATIASGLLVAVLFRWGSMWSAVVIKPYLDSLVQLAPRGELVAGLPFLVRAHLLCMMSLMVVIPFSSLGALCSRTEATTSAART